MSNQSPLPLLAVQPLADRALQPAACRLVFAVEDAQALPPSLAGLAARQPCFVGGDDPMMTVAEGKVALLAAGCQPMPPGQVISTTQLPAVLPPIVKWVHGEWYMAAPVKPTGNQAVSRAAALRLVELVAKDADNHELEAVFRQDAGLSYQLLRVVNSVGVAPGRKVSSFSQAILLLGRQQLRRWLNLMLFAARKEDKRSAMLLARVAVRARAMELLAWQAGQDKVMQEAAFMGGMFSLLGVLFGLPLEEVLKPLRLSDVLAEGVLHRQGVIGALLKAVEGGEQADFASIGVALEALQAKPSDFNEALIQAALWALDVSKGEGNA